MFNLILYITYRRRGFDGRLSACTSNVRDRVYCGLGMVNVALQDQA